MRHKVLFVHGAFCRGAAWRGWQDRFEARGFETLAPDLRHHDPTPGAPPDPRLATTGVNDYFEDLARLIERFGDKPIVVGHSMGGLLAQMLAARGLASACVLLAPSSPWGIPPATADQAMAALGLARTGAFWDTALVPAFEIAASNSLNRLAPDAQKDVFRLFVPESGRALFEILFWAMDVQRRTEVDESEVDCRLLAMTGEDDLICPPQALSPLA